MKNMVKTFLVLGILVLPAYFSIGAADEQEENGPDIEEVKKGLDQNPEKTLEEKIEFIREHPGLVKQWLTFTIIQTY